MIVHFVESKVDAAKLAHSLPGSQIYALMSDAGEAEIETMLDRAMTGTLILHDFDEWTSASAGQVMTRLRRATRIPTGPVNVIVVWSATPMDPRHDRERARLIEFRMLRRNATHRYIETLVAEFRYPRLDEPLA